MSLQDAMGLSENKPLYSHCRVSRLCIFPDCIWLILNYIVDCSRCHMHAGLPTDVDWCNQDPVAIGKIAQVVRLKSFHFINYSLLHIAKAISRNKHLKCYKENWVTIKIMKTLLKNRCSNQPVLGSLIYSNLV